MASSVVFVVLVLALVLALASFEMEDEGLDNVLIHNLTKYLVVEALASSQLSTDQYKIFVENNNNRALKKMFPGLRLVWLDAKDAESFEYKNALGEVVQPKLGLSNGQTVLPLLDPSEISGANLKYSSDSIYNLVELKDSLESAIYSYDLPQNVTAEERAVLRGMKF